MDKNNICNSSHRKVCGVIIQHTELCKFNHNITLEFYQSSSDLHFSNSSAQFICFWMSTKYLWRRVEHERYYHFNRRLQEIKPCEWGEEAPVYACVGKCVHAYMQVCVFVCVATWNGQGKKLIYENRSLRSWSKKKMERNSCMQVDTIACPCTICARVQVIAFDVRREKRLAFPLLCFIQQDTHIHEA